MARVRVRERLQLLSVVLAGALCGMALGWLLVHLLVTVPTP